MNYLTGFHAIEEALRAAGRGSGVLHISGKGPRINRIEELARKKGTRIVKAAKGELDALVGGDHRGAVLEIDAAPSRMSFDGFIEGLSPEGEDPVLVVLLDGVTDPHNLGAIIRSADQFEADLVVLPERRSAPESAVVANSSAGAVNHVPLVRVPNLPRAAELLKQRGFWIYAAMMGGEAAGRTDLTGRVALVLGSEGKGVSPNLARHCDAEIAVPTRGRVDSLNVSVAAGILLYEVRRQQGW